jgi:hypothetical protein
MSAASQCLTKSKVKAHEVRAIASSWENFLFCLLDRNFIGRIFGGQIILSIEIYFAVMSFCLFSPPEFMCCLHCWNQKCDVGHTSAKLE